MTKEVFARLDMDELNADYRMEQTYTANLRTFEDSLKARTAAMEGRAPAWVQELMLRALVARLREGREGR